MNESEENIEVTKNQAQEKLGDLNVHSPFNVEQASIDDLLLTNKNLRAVVADLQQTNADLVRENLQQEKGADCTRNNTVANSLKAYSSYQFFDNNDVLLMKFPSEIIAHLDAGEINTAQTLKDMLTGPEIAELFRNIGNVYVNGETIVKEIESVGGKWIQLRLTAQKDGCNRTNSVNVTFYNITTLKNNQLDLTNRNRKLSRINEDLDNFVYAASHDLLGPLGNIEASLSGIQRKSDDKDFQVYLQVIDSSIKKFSALIRNLATIAKIESEMTEMEPVDLNEVITDVKWSVENKLNAVNAVIILDLETDSILFSKKNLQSIIYNLISNAIKFRSNAPPVIKITTKIAGDNTVLVVQDNGRGIPALAIDKIFKMYGRLNSDIEGSGIGLYLAKKIINAAGGEINVYSEEGKGSDFVISLPNKVSRAEL